METFNKNIDFFEFVALADAKGNIIASSDPAHIGSINVLDRDYFQESFSGKTAVSKVIKSKGSGNPIFCISSPVKQNNVVVGLLLGAIDLNYFTKAFVDAERVGGNRLCLYHRHGRTRDCLSRQIKNTGAGLKSI